MPLGAHRHITAYDRVIVGSDGSRRRCTPSAGRTKSQPRPAWSWSPPRPAPPEQGGLVGGRQRLYGKEAARAAMHSTVAELTSDRVRAVEQDIVAGEPVEALQSGA